MTTAFWNTPEYARHIEDPLVSLQALNRQATEKNAGPYSNGVFCIYKVMEATHRAFQKIRRLQWELDRALDTYPNYGSKASPLREAEIGRLRSDACDTYTAYGS